MEVILKYISQLDIPLDKLHDPYLAVSSQITDDLLKPDEQPIFSQAKDIYNDSLSEQKFLRSKPVCFIIFGKPGSGKTQLSKSIAASWNCVYINPHALLLEVLEQATDISLDILKTLDNGELVEDEITFQLLDERMKASDVEHHGYILDGFPVVDQSFMTITEQMEWITNRAYPPDFILNIKMTHEDNIYRRETQRLDPISGMILGKEIYDPDDNIPLLLQQQQQQSPSQQSPEEETKELKSDEGLADASDMFLPEDAERLVQQPEDMPDNPEADHQNYFTNSLPVIEDYIASFEQQYVMLLDANQPSDILHKQCLAKFELSGLSPAAYVHVLNKEQESDDIDGPTVFRTYCSKEIVSGQYTWKKSHWDRYCPVALYYGNIVKGKTEFAVGFLNKIYFLSSAEYFDMFIRNPRPYLLSPQPRPPCKLIVLGMPKTGKSSLCYLLAKKYNAKVIQMSYILKEVMECRRKEKYAEWLRLAIDRSIAAVRKNVELDFYEELAKREARMEAMRAHSPTESALDAAEEIIDELLENVEEQRSSSEKEFSSEGRSSSPEKEVLSEGQTSQTSRDVTEVDS
ncbi:adenylate kinase 9-like, partial [Argonauta hians]